MLGKRVSIFLYSLTAFSTAHASVVFSDNFSYPDGPLVLVSNGRWETHSGTSGQINAAAGLVKLSQRNTEDVSAVLVQDGAISATNTAALYAGFKINFSALPTGPGTYFAHFKDASPTTGFRCRVFACTNGAAVGTYRIGIASAATEPSQVLDEDLNLNVAYRVICRLILSNSLSALWLNPNAETDRHVTSTDSAASKTVTAFAFRESLAAGAGMGELTVDDLIVSTTFAETGPHAAPPTILAQPKDATALAGSDARFAVQADGTPPLAYQWLFEGTELPGATGAQLVLTSVRMGDAGQYQALVANGAGSVLSAPAILTVEPSLPPVTISLRPGAGIVLRWPAAADQTYSIWAVDQLPAEFTLLAGGLSFPDGNGLFEDDPGGIPARFYWLSTP